jgi:IS30 family transposase
MLSYKHFTLNERKYLQELLAEGKSMRKIAAILGRSASSVSREIKRNRSKYPKKSSNNRYCYSAWRAENLAVIRRRRQDRRCLHPDTPEWNYIVAGLKVFWTPEEICGRWARRHLDAKKLHFSTIYRYISNGEFSGISRKTHLRRRGKRILPRNSSYNSIQPEHLITERPAVINDRLRVGDWEGDTVYGGVGKGLLVTFVDRKTRFLRAALLDSRSAELTKDVIVQMMSGYPVESITLDNGSEFSEFRALEEELGTTVYFAEPHKPWQRGTNENTNDLLRFFFPKGTDFHAVTQEQLDYVVKLINDRPRKCLNYQSPAGAFEKECKKSVALH